MAIEDWYKDLTDILKAKGHSDEEVTKIVHRVKEYDLETQHDSVMDSLDGGGFNLDAIIEEALKES